MLRYDSVDNTPPDYEPVRKFLVMILMMAVRDRASHVRFSREPDRISAWYYVEEKWYEFLPPPSYIWPELLEEIRRASRLVVPERRASWWERIRHRLIHSRSLATGWLTFRVIDRDVLYRVRFDPHPVSDEILLELDSPVVDLEGIEFELSDDVIEFDAA